MFSRFRAPLVGPVIEEAKPEDDIEKYERDMYIYYNDIFLFSFLGIIVFLIGLALVLSPIL